MLDTAKIAEWIKLAPRYLGALALASGVYLLLGPNQLRQLGLLSHDPRIRPWIGAAFLIAGSLLTAHAVAHGWSRLTRKRHKDALKRARERRLHALSPEERAVLAAYIHGNTKTCHLDITHGVAGGLEADQIIFKTSPVSLYLYTFAFNIQPWAWDYLHAHPEILGPPDETPSDDEHDDA